MSSYTSSSLTLRSLLKSAASRLRLGVLAPRVSGLTAPAKALYAAVAAERGRVLLVVPTDADIETMTRDARFFFSALEGLSDTEVERAVLPFPSHEVDPYRGLAPHFDIASARARALHAMAQGNCALVDCVGRRASPAAESARSAEVGLTHADTRPRHLADDLGDLLAAAGYTRQDPVDENGEFCVRGGVVDFYPAGAREPVRLEFVGDTIESIRSLRPRHTAVDSCPRPGLDRAASGAARRFGPPGPIRDGLRLSMVVTAGPCVLLSEPDEIRAQGEKLTSRFRRVTTRRSPRATGSPPPSESR